MEPCRQVLVTADVRRAVCLVGAQGANISPKFLLRLGKQSLMRVVGRHPHGNQLPRVSTAHDLDAVVRWRRLLRGRFDGRAQLEVVESRGGAWILALGPPSPRPRRLVMLPVCVDRRESTRHVE